MLLGNGRRTFRRLALAGVIFALVLLGIRFFSIQGLIKPVRIVSGSMAPAFLGPRYEVRCGDCGYSWAIDAARTSAEDIVVCSNCGYSRNELASATLKPGQRVLIDRGAFWLRSPQRWEAVAFRDPTSPEQLAVKRVIALPGESVQVRGGELYLDGRQVRKPLAQLREMAVPVYDDRFRPQDESLPDRWGDEDGHWSRSGKTYFYPGDFQPSKQLERDPQFAWLTYHHWRCSPLPSLRTKETPVLDDYGYNLGPSRQLNYVTDLALSCRMKTIGEGLVAISFDDGQGLWRIEISPRRGQISVIHDGARVAATTFARVWDEAFLLEAAICDGQILAGIDRRQIIAHPCEPSAAEFRPSSRPFALGAAGLAVEASELIITRDVHYLPPPGRAAWKIGPLGDDELILLGDNAPISLDSRTWPQPELGKTRLLGQVLRRP